jgi:hypothetical protein
VGRKVKAKKSLLGASACPSPGKRQRKNAAPTSGKSRKALINPGETTNLSRTVDDALEDQLYDDDLGLSEEEQGNV